MEQKAIGSFQLTLHHFILSGTESKLRLVHKVTGLDLIGIGVWLMRQESQLLSSLLDVLFERGLELARMGSVNGYVRAFINDKLDVVFEMALHAERGAEVLEFA